MDEPSLEATISQIHELLVEHSIKNRFKIIVSAIIQNTGHQELVSRQSELETIFTAVQLEIQFGQEPSPPQPQQLH